MKFSITTSPFSKKSMVATNLGDIERDLKKWKKQQINFSFFSKNMFFGNISFPQTPVTFLNHDQGRLGVEFGQIILRGLVLFIIHFLKIFFQFHKKILLFYPDDARHKLPGSDSHRKRPGKNEKMTDEFFCSFWKCYFFTNILFPQTRDLKSWPGRSGVEFGQIISRGIWFIIYCFFPIS